MRFFLTSYLGQLIKNEIKINNNKKKTNVLFLKNLMTGFNLWVKTKYKKYIVIKIS